MSLELDPRERASVLADLASRDEEVRRLAVERVVALPPDEAVERLMASLGDPSWRVRKAAVERLAARASRRGVLHNLVEALGDDENTGRRNAAAEALVRCGARSVPVLVEAARGGDSDVRKLAVDALAGIGDTAARDVLMERLRDPDPNVRAAAADALGAAGDAEVRGALLEVATCEEQDKLVRYSALQALAALEAPVDPAALDGVLADTVLRSAGLAILGGVEDEGAVARLLVGLACESRSPREVAIRALLRQLAARDGSRAAELAERVRATATPQAVDDAVARLGAGDLELRRALVQFLGLLRAPEVLLPILRAARDEALAPLAMETLAQQGELAEETLEAAWSSLDAIGRRDACRLFGSLSGAPSAARLVASLSDGDGELRASAARAAAGRHLTEALPGLVEGLEQCSAERDFESEEETEALSEALVTLARPGPGVDPEVTREATALLVARLGAASEGARIAMAAVLGGIAGPEDAEPVGALLRDPSSAVRRAAVNALAGIGAASESLRLALADESPAVRVAAIGALGSAAGDADFWDLKRLCEDREPRVRAAAVRAVALRFAGNEHMELGDGVATVLSGALDDDGAVALAAVAALREVGGEQALRVADALGRPEPEFLQEAVRCLSAHGGDEGIEAVIPLASHPDWSVRAEAIEAVGERRFRKAVPAILRRLDVEQDEFVRGVILRSLERLEG